MRVKTEMESQPLYNWPSIHGNSVNPPSPLLPSGGLFYLDSYSNISSYVMPRSLSVMLPQFTWVSTSKCTEPFQYFEFLIASFR